MSIQDENEMNPQDEIEDDELVDDVEEQIELDDEDLRELERLGEDLIPPVFKHFMIENCNGDKITARTSDFSEKGLRLAIDGKHNLKSEETVLLHTLTGNLQLEGQIKYCLLTNTRSETSYLGIYLLKSHSIDEYIRLVNEKRVQA